MSALGNPTLACILRRMSNQGKEMSELLILKTAAKETGVDPSHLRHEILLGKLPADKFGGRDWWIRRGDLLAWYAQRRSVRTTACHGAAAC